jgi:replicative DNA helicase
MVGGLLSGVDGGLTGGRGAAAQLAAAPPAPAAPPAEPAGPDTAPLAALPSPLGEPLAEAAALGCVLRGGPDVAREVLSRLTPGDWTVPVHAHVAAAASALLSRGEPVDPVTVLGQLRRGGLENARTASRDAGVLLIELCQGAPTTSSAGHYVRIVLEHSYRRRAQQAAIRLQQAAETGSLKDLSAVIDREHAALTTCRQRIEATLPG